MAEYKIPRFKYEPPTRELCYGHLSEMSYESPITLTISQMRIEQEKRVEGEVYSAIQECGIAIDKEELIKALQYDRDQYRKGFVDGCKVAEDGIIQRAKADTVREFEARFAMHFGTYTNEDTIKVRDVFKLLSKFAEKMLEEET